MRKLLPSLVVAAALGVSAAAIADAQALVPLAPPSTDQARGPITVGSKAPAFALVAGNGSVYRLADLHGKKSLVLVFFRGVW